MWKIIRCGKFHTFFLTLPFRENLFFTSPSTDVVNLTQIIADGERGRHVGHRHLPHSHQGTPPGRPDLQGGGGQPHWLPGGLTQTGCEM